MKLQHLAIIFIIIIFPIALLVGEYIQIQIDTILLQTSYSSKLQTATYDSMKAFRLNTVNNKYSSISDSKVRDIEAAISTYFTSLGNEIKMDAYARADLEEYTPALLYTLYDGYYIYSKYYNDTDKEYQYGLKPYVYYTCRYKKSNIDIIVNYTLDNYITIYGTIGENYITKSGNIINPDKVTDIKWQDEKLYSLKYGSGADAVTIEQEVLEEQIIYLDTNNAEHRETYSYIIYNNNKIYYDGINYFTINNSFKKQYVTDQKTINELKEYTRDGKIYSDSALNYYYEAYLFSKWARQYLGTVTQEHAVDENGNKITDFAIKTKNKPIFVCEGETKLEDTAFEHTRISVLRRTIQSNLLTAIANYNNLSQKGYEYVLPVFNEEDWYKLTSNISVTSFLQGIPIGTKYFNDYCIITNNVNKEVVNLDSLFVITEKDEIHLVNCKSILDEGIKAKKAYKNIDFERQTVVISEGNERYYYPHYETKCYNCLVNVAQTYDIDFVNGIVKEFDVNTNEYVEKTNVNLNTLYYLRKEVLQALGRESYDLYKVNEYFKGYDETISTDSITLEKTSNLTTSVKWNSSTNKAIVTASKKAGIAETLKIQYIINPTNSQISDNTAWQTVNGNTAYIQNLFLNDKVYFRLYDGTYDGDYVTRIVKDNIAPQEGKIEVVEGTMGNNGYYTSDVVKVKITAGKDKESGVNRLTYSLMGSVSVSEKTISDGQIIEIPNNGTITIRARTIDNAGNSSVKMLQIKKDSLAPNKPVIQVSGSRGSNGYYNSTVNVKFIHGKDQPLSNSSNVKALHYEIENNGKVTRGSAYDGQSIQMNKQGIIIIRAYMEDNAGNKSAVVSNTINRDTNPPVQRSNLTSSDVTSNSFTLNITVQDEVSGINRIVWYYKKSTEYTYKTNTTNCLGEKEKITKQLVLNNLSSGVYNAYAIVYDRAGNMLQTGQIRVTTKNVEIASGAVASPTGWTNQNVTVTLPTKSGYKTQYQTGNSVNVNGTWRNYVGELTITTNTRVYYRYSDGTNTGSYATLTITNIDKLAPGATIVTYNSGANSCSWKNNYDIGLSATDANSTISYGRSGIAYFEIDGNGDGASDGIVLNIYRPANGYSSHNARFRAVDEAGNKGPWTSGHHIHMDTEKPGEVTVTYKGGSNSCSWKNNYNIQLSTSDNISIANYEIDWNGDGVTDSTTGSSFVPGNGYDSHNTRFRAVDSAGNKGSWSSAHHIHMDTQKPTINSGLSYSTATKQFTLSLSATDTLSGMGKVVWYYKSSSASSYSTKTTAATGTKTKENKSVTITNASGTYNAYAEVYDSAGNKTTTSTVTINVHTHTASCYHSHDSSCRHYHSGTSYSGTGCYTRVVSSYCGGGDVMWYCRGCRREQGIGNRYGTTHAPDCLYKGTSDGNTCTYHTRPCSDWYVEYGVNCGYSSGQIICGKSSSDLICGY